MPRLLINADDFGLHPDIDRGILACIDAGRLTGTSVCANGPHVDWSAVRALATRGIDVGVHVTLVGEPWLTKPRTFASWSQLVPWLMLPGRRATLEAEVRRQIETFREQGVAPTHLDSHQHVHVMPTIWDVCTTLAHEFGIPRVRVPRAPDRSVAKPTIAGRALEQLSRRRARSIDVPVGPPCIGLAHAGHNTAAIYERELNASAGGDVELVAHPGFNTPALESIYSAWRFDWDAERDALLSDVFGHARERFERSADSL